MMACEMNPHPLGHEIRLYIRGEFQSSQVFATAEAAAAEAETHRQAGSRRPALPPDGLPGAVREGLRLRSAANRGIVRSSSRPPDCRPVPRSSQAPAPAAPPGG